MLSPKLVEALRKQIGSELTASHQYLAVASYFGMQSLNGWAEFFFRQSDEEKEHAMKIINFLLRCSVEPRFPALAEAKPNFKSVLDAVERCLRWEKEVTKQFYAMADVALKEKDYTTFQFLQWFIEEQVEEEDLMTQLVDLVRSGINLFQAEPLLPKPE
ncbi:MAG TPA: ferritin [Fimbriimonadales bacterium]|nr:ferritin [Fimbriimonadales bacterium]